MRLSHKIIIIIVAIAFLPIIVAVSSYFAMQVINAAAQGFQNLLHPLSMSGDARLEGTIKLCLYLIAITLLIKFLIGPRGQG